MSRWNCDPGTQSWDLSRIRTRYRAQNCQTGLQLYPIDGNYGARLLCVFWLSGQYSVLFFPATYHNSLSLHKQISH